MLEKASQLNLKTKSMNADSYLPEGWATASFMDVFNIQGGTQPSKKHFVYKPRKGYIRLLQIRDFGEKPLPTFVPFTNKLKTCAKDDVLIGRYGASVGRICTGMEGAYNVALTKVIVPDGIDLKFVYYLLQSHFFQRPILDIERSAQNGFNKGDLSRIDIPICPIEEQKRIVAKVEELLARVNVVRERLAKVKEILRLFRQSVHAAACSGRLTEDCKAEKTRDESSANNTLANSQAKLSTAKADNVSTPELPESWDWTALKAICEYQGGFAFKSKKFLNEGKNQVLRIGNVRPGYIDFDIAPVYIDDEYAAAKKGFQVMENDILVSMTGTKYKRDYGYAGIVAKTDKGAFLNQRVGRLRAGPAIQPEFLLYWLQTKTFRDFFFQNETGNVNQGNVGAEALRQTPAPVPPMTEQLEIARRVEALFNIADVIERRVTEVGQRAERLTNAILSKAFRGELVPSEAELARQEDRIYEPSHVLLEKIRKGGVRIFPFLTRTMRQ